MLLQQQRTAVGVTAYVNLFSIHNLHGGGKKIVNCHPRLKLKERENRKLNIEKNLIYAYKK